MQAVKVLLVTADPEVRGQMAVTARALRRRMDPSEPLQLLEADDGDRGSRLAWTERPEVVLADEITSRAGAFALAKELTGADPPFAGRVIILLDRRQDAWLADWAGADAWMVKPVDPFRLAEMVAEPSTDKEAG
jgi:DNA-binding NarL/FixJ family response regulator